MQRILSHIEYLLDRYECVTIPGFGAFIKHTEPAQIDESTGVIIPPKRFVMFNSDITHDDGLLASSYAQAQSITYTAAAGEMHRDIEELKALLNNNGEYSLGDLGKLKSENGLINYLPANSLFHTYGYTKVNAKTLAVVNQEHKQAKTLSAPSKWQQTAHNLMRYAAIFILTLTVGIVLSTPIVNNDNTVINRASLNPIEMTISQSEPIGETATPELLIYEPRVVEIQAETIETTTIDKYALIIASLATESQARQFINEHQDCVKGMFESNGRYRVYAITGPTINSVLNSDIMAQHPDAWVCQLP